MIKKNGQTALILILLAAAALIFLAISLNWGRVAQTKTMMTIAADQSAATLASDVASYGEMQKKSNLEDKNQKGGWGGAVLAFFTFIICVVKLVFDVFTQPWKIPKDVAAVGMAITNLVLQLTVVPSLTESLWNKEQQNQPYQQQFFEQGISTAFQGTVTDQVNIRDYFDWNASGQFNGSVSRFALFYGDRRKMLNQPDNPAVVYFYNQLGMLVNGGETCGQNVSDYYFLKNNNQNNMTIDPSCSQCAADYADNPSAQTLSNKDCAAALPNGFRLNDACTPNSDPASKSYTPYCDPCCVLASVPDPAYCAPGSANCTPNPLHPAPYNIVRPSFCPQPPDPASCAINPNGPGCVPSQCYVNNPYNTSKDSNDSPYPLLYDPAYQNYNNTTKDPSFLDQYGRDMQKGPFTPLTIQGDFPNGVYPFFWLMKDYSPEVDKIDPTSTAPLSSSQYHWCVAGNYQSGAIPSVNTPSATAFPDLAQLGQAPFNLSYVCSGQDCCVNYLGGSVINGVLSGGPVNVPAPASLLTNNVIDIVGSSNPAADPSFGENGSGTWLEGDNQFCSNTSGILGACANPDGTASSCTPGSKCSDGSTCSPGTYNGSSLNFPDGMCEWTNSTDSSKAPSSATPASTSTVDSLDDTMHTLSDFVNFSNKFFGTDVDTLSATFDSWYSQISPWIAPANEQSVCGVDPSTCSGSGKLQCLAKLAAQQGACVSSIEQSVCRLDTSTCSGSGQSQCIAMLKAQQALCVKETLNSGGADGRLLALPKNLGIGYNVITAWLKNDYSNAGAWCVPPATTGSANEDNAVTNNGTLTWGSLPSVIACLNYNTSPTLANNYQTCLNDLKNQSSSACSFPASCAPAILGRTNSSGQSISLAGQAPSFTPGSSTTTSSNACGSCGCSSAPPSSSTSPGPGLGSTTTTTVTTTCGTGLDTSCNTCCVPDPPPATTCTDITSCDSCGSTTFCNGSCSGITSTQVTYNSADCDPTVAGSYANWVQNSYTLANDEAPKFALRAQYLNDIYSRATTMQTIFATGSAKLAVFLSGPAQQLINARGKPSPVATLPNSVIYGWIDGPPGCGGQGCAHIVKITAYSPGRAGDPPVNINGTAVKSLLPWLKTHQGILRSDYTLTDRDGPVYVSIKRWDEEHSNPVAFPNGHSLWQSMFHNPAKPNKSSSSIGGGSIGTACAGVPLTGQKIGFGLGPKTIAGLGLASVNILQQDVTALSHAFMLNDEGDGKVDPQNLDAEGHNGPTCAQGNNSTYCQCLSEANKLLDTAPESHACAVYIASTDATHYPSGDTNYQHDRDYTLKFVSCGQAQDDLSYEGK